MQKGTGPDATWLFEVGNQFVEESAREFVPSSLIYLIIGGRVQRPQAPHISFNQGTHERQRGGVQRLLDEKSDGRLIPVGHV